MTRLLICLLALVALTGCYPSHWRTGEYNGKKVLCREASTVDPWYECIDADLSKVKP